MRRVSLATLATLAAFATLASCGVELAGTIDGDGGAGGIDASADSSPAPGSDAADDVTRGDATPPVDGGQDDADAAPSSDGSPNDAAGDAPDSSDAGPDGASDGGADASDAGTTCTCTTPVPAGWTVVDYIGAPVGATKCPATTATQQVDESPRPQLGACMCGGEVITAPATCPSGTLRATGSTAQSNNSCFTTNNFDMVMDGACHGGTWNLPDHASAQPPQASGGTCTATVTAHQDKVSVANPDLCIPQATGCAAACNPPTGVAECIVQDGDVPCPPGSAYSDHHTIGDGTNVTCGPCSCSVSGQCSPKVTFLGPPGCTGSTVTTWTPTGKCDDPGGTNNAPIAAYSVAQILTGERADSRPTTQDANVTNPRTVCCR